MIILNNDYNQTRQPKIIHSYLKSLQIGFNRKRQDKIDKNNRDIKIKLRTTVQYKASIQN